MNGNKDIGHNQIVIHTTCQVIDIAELINLTEIRDKVSGFLYLYAQRYNISMFDLPAFCKKFFMEEISLI